MKRERNLGQEILEGIQDIKDWKQGKKALKVTKVSLPSARDVANIRHKLRLNQDEFADLMGVSVKTLRNWEQNRREPQGPARSLLRIAEKAPTIVLRVLPRHAHRSIYTSAHRARAIKKK